MQPPPSDPACWAALPLPLQTRLRHTVASLHSLLASLGAKEEIWSVGNLARYILEECISFQICCKYSVSLKYWTDIGHMVRSLGDQLEAWTPARTRRKTASNKVLWCLRLTQNQEKQTLPGEPHLGGPNLGLCILLPGNRGHTIGQSHRHSATTAPPLH